MKKVVIVLSAAVIASVAFSFQTPSAVNGEKIFKQNCGACHTVGKGKIVGPDLKGVTVRRTEAWLLKFIKSSQTMVKSGDKTAVALFNENNKIPMPDQNLSPQQIKDVLAYIKTGK